jgi:hypothetical protein
LEEERENWLFLRGFIQRLYNNRVDRQTGNEAPKVPTSLHPKYLCYTPSVVAGTTHQRTGFELMHIVCSIGSYVCFYVVQICVTFAFLGTPCTYSTVQKCTVGKFIRELFKGIRVQQLHVRCKYLRVQICIYCKAHTCRKKYKGQAKM